MTYLHMTGWVTQRSECSRRRISVRERRLSLQKHLNTLMRTPMWVFSQGYGSLATKIVNDLGSGTVVSSGSGAHVYIPIKPVQVEDREALSDELRKWNTSIKTKYSTPTLKIDNIWDLPR